MYWKTKQVLKIKEIRYLRIHHLFWLVFTFNFSYIFETFFKILKSLQQAINDKNLIWFYGTLTIASYLMPNLI